MKNSVLLVLAIFTTALVFIPLLVRQTILIRNVEEFHLDLAKELDKLWCYLIWRIKGHTVSAMSYGKGKKYAVEIIDGIFYLAFGERDHCYKTWRNEFN